MRFSEDQAAMPATTGTLIAFSDGQAMRSHPFPAASVRACASTHAAAAELMGCPSACALLRYSQVEVWTGGGGVSVTVALATGPLIPRSMTTSEPEARRRFMAQSNPIQW
jgi:hypothetical protein